MEEIIATVGDIVFDIERDLDEQVGALPLPFSGMDKSGSATCVFHLRGSCHRASMCPYRHIKPDRTVVCKHWLRGLCKKGDSCEFLHEYDMSKMPECYFYSKFRACSNKECPFLHIDPESKVKDCPWYDRGFCRHGPNCRHRHTRRVACINYLCGFCPDGSSCKFVHMRFDIPSNLPAIGPGGIGTVTDPSSTSTSSIPMIKKGMVICHYCNEVGHKIYTCNAIPPDQKDEVIQKFTEQQQQYYASHNENRPNNYQQSSFHHHNSNHHHHNPHHHGNPNHHHNSNNFNNNNNNSGSNGPATLHLSSSSTNNNNGDSTIVGPPGKDGKPMIFRPLDQVTCFKCGEKGHYANKCPKGYLAFLSPALKDLHKRNANEAGGGGGGGPPTAPIPGNDP